MNRILFPIAALILASLLSSCRDPSVRMRIGQKMPLEEAGLKIERLDEIDCAGAVGAPCDLVSNLYQARGYLAYRALRIRNEGDHPLHFYPLVDPISGSKVLEMKTRLMGLYRRDEPAPIDINGSAHLGEARNAFDYRADFVMVGAQLEYGDAVEEVPLSDRPEERNRQATEVLRPGESAVLVYRLRLSESTPFIPSAAPGPGGRVPTFIYRSDLPTNLGPYRGDFLIGRMTRMRYFPEFLVVVEGSEETRPLFIPSDLRNEVVKYQPIALDPYPSAARAPDETVSQREEGLPELVL